MTTKREQVERDARISLGEHFYKDEEDFFDALRAAGFTLCGPDEVPMPKTLTNETGAAAPELRNGQYMAMIDAYQRKRNGG